MIETGGSGRLWLLSGPGSSYALHLTDRDELLHLHWGRRIALSDAEALAAEPLPAPRPLESALDGREEYPARGGVPRAARPALAVRSRWGSGVEWCFEEYEVGGGGRAREPEAAGEPGEYAAARGPGGAAAAGEYDGDGPGGGDGPGAEELRLHFHDSRHHLDLTLHYRMRPGCDVVERWTTAAHAPGGHREPLELLRADAATWTPPYRDGWRASRLQGRWGAESRLVRAALPPGEQLLSGRPGQAGLPWFALDPGDTGEEHGEVWTAALACSGPWRIALSSLPDGRVQATGGAGQDGRPLARLAPGESYTSPVFAALWSGGGFGAASRAWHSYQRAHVLPGGSRVRPVAYRCPPAGGFGAVRDPGGAERQNRLVRQAAAVGAELFVVDDGPPCARLHDRYGTGDWEPDRERFPDGVKPLSDEAHALGMRFGVRVDAETVGADGELCRAHPEWVLPAAAPGAAAGRPDRLVLDLARADVRDHVLQQLAALLRSAPVDHLAWDAAHPADAEGRYALLDRLRAAHPRLTVESATGGLADLGLLARAHPVAASGSDDPLDRLHLQHGFGQLHPAAATSTWVTDSPTPDLNHRRSSLRFRFVSAMTGALGISGDLLEWGAEERAEAASWTALYKTVRPVVQLGDLHRLRPPGTGGLTAVQYVHGPDTVVLAWLPAQEFGTPPPPLRLRGLERDASYRDMATGVVQRGAVLAERGLRTTLGGDLDAAVFHLRRVRPAG
jgi:alpha-galactosidase